MKTHEVKFAGVNQKFMEFLQETKNLNEAMKLLQEWDAAHSYNITQRSGHLLSTLVIISKKIYIFLIFLLNW